MSPVRRSPITWTDFSGADLNFVIRGRDDCPISEGCERCYVPRTLRGRMPEKTTIYPEKLKRLARTNFSWEAWKSAPFRRGPGSRPMAFVVDLGDLFHEEVAEDFITRAFEVMIERADIDWQILTKRPRRALEIISGFWLVNPSDPRNRLPRNVWLGVTAENQKRADERIPILLNIPATVRFVSVEPMLGPVDVAWAISPNPLDIGAGFLLRGHFAPGIETLRPLDWVICGAESGPKRRPFDKDWARSLRDQCQAANVPFLYKQSSGLYPGADPVLGGREWRQFPR